MKYLKTDVILDAYSDQTATWPTGTFPRNACGYLHIEKHMLREVRKLIKFQQRNLCTLPFEQLFVALLLRENEEIQWGDTPEELWERFELKTTEQRHRIKSVTFIAPHLRFPISIPAEKAASPFSSCVVAAKSHARTHRITSFGIVRIMGAI